MLDVMPWLKLNPDCNALVDQVMHIGRKKTAIIQRYSGLAAAGQNPSPVFGEYLAHYAVLETTYKSPPAEPYPPESQEVGYHPRGLDDEVEKGYNDARIAVQEFESLTEEVLSRVSGAFTRKPIMPSPIEPT